MGGTSVAAASEAVTPDNRAHNAGRLPLQDAAWLLLLLLRLQRLLNPIVSRRPESPHPGKAGTCKIVPRVSECNVRPNLSFSGRIKHKPCVTT